MKVSTAFINEVLKHTFDYTSIDIVFYIINNYNCNADERLTFISKEFLKNMEKSVNNTNFICDTFLKNLFFKTMKINGNEVIFKMKPEMIYHLNDYSKGGVDVDVSVLHRLTSIYSKKIYLYFLKEKFKDEGIYDFAKLKEDLNIQSYNSNYNFTHLLKTSFEEINEIIPFNFKTSLMKKGKKAIKLVCFFKYKPEETFAGEPKEYIEIPKSIPEIKEEIISPTPKIEFKQEFIENTVNYQPVIENVVHLETKKIINNINDENMIDMDNDKINNLFGDIDFILNNPKEEVINENEKFVKPKIVSPVILHVQTIPNVPKEEIKEIPKTLLDKTMNYIRNIDNCKYEMMFIDEPKMITKFEIKENNKVVIIDFRDLWSKQNLIDNKYIPNNFDNNQGRILKFLKQVTGNDFDMKITVKGVFIKDEIVKKKEVK